MIAISVILAIGLGGVVNVSRFQSLGKGNVGIIELTGVIADSKPVINHIKQFRENAAIKAIVLRIDSPGGTVGSAQEIYREIRKTVTTKTVVASMGTVAASGGYYVAAGANEIMANPGTITGSIGVILGYTNFKELFDKIGLTPVVIKSGPYKDLGSPVRPMTDAERNILQTFVEQTRGQFVRAISTGRNMPLEKVDALADGRIFTGEQALEMGLIDRLGNLEDAIEFAGRKGGIEGRIIPVYARDRRFGFLEQLIGSAAHSFINKLINDASLPAYLMDLR
ncbi:MAG: signal peptide peptidase SppA [Deltaproteobacteria bacterium]|nr:signal peptide peptidase SppA [Deltaproteobacteria bacterium]